MSKIKRFLKWLNDGAGWEFGMVACMVACLSGCLTSQDPEQTEFSRTYHVRELGYGGKAITQGGDTLATSTGFLFIFRTGTPPKQCLAFVIDSVMAETEVICRTFEADSAKIAILRSEFYAIKRAMWVRMIWRTE